MELAAEVGGWGSGGESDVNTYHRVVRGGSRETFLVFCPPPMFPKPFGQTGVWGEGEPSGWRMLKGRMDWWMDKLSWRQGFAPSLCWLMKSLLACLSNQMAEQSAQNEQERTRLQQQHSMEKDRLVQDQQREVSSLQREARAALQQHQQHTQEWKKRDAQVGGLHWSMFAHTCWLYRDEPCRILSHWCFAAGYEHFLKIFFIFKNYCLWHFFLPFKKS